MEINDENRLPRGVYWRFLEHKGPLFCKDYERLPENVNFFYEGKVLRLTEVTEECAKLYAELLDIQVPQLFGDEFGDEFGDKFSDHQIG